MLHFKITGGNCITHVLSLSSLSRSWRNKSFKFSATTRCDSRSFSNCIIDEKTSVCVFPTDAKIMINLVKRVNCTSSMTPKLLQYPHQQTGSPDTHFRGSVSPKVRITSQQNKNLKLEVSVQIRAIHIYIYMTAKTIEKKCRFSRRNAI